MSNAVLYPSEAPFDARTKASVFAPDISLKLAQSLKVMQDFTQVKPLVMLAH
jgi:hypothetical protein